MKTEGKIAVYSVRFGNILEVSDVSDLTTDMNLYAANALKVNPRTGLTYTLQDMVNEYAREVSHQGSWEVVSSGFKELDRYVDQINELEEYEVTVVQRYTGKQVTQEEFYPGLQFYDGTEVYFTVK